MRYRAIGFAVAVALAACAAAEATVVIPADLRKLTRDAQAIVHGRVIDIRSQWAPDRNAMETLVTLEADGYMKGNYGAQVVFRVSGGQIGRYRTVTVGAPVFKVGEEVVVFLKANGPVFPRVVGFNQGVFRVSVDRATRRRVVTSPVLAREVRAPAPLVRGDLRRKPVTLDDLEQRVRSILEDERKGNIAKPRGGAAVKRGR